MKGYRLTNFKAFDGTNCLPLRPITLIYGANSSGKSSILQSLLLLKQSIDEAETPETILLPKGNLVDLGSHVDFVHKHDPARRVTFELILDARSLNKAPGVLGKLIELVDPPTLGVRLTFAPERDGVGAQLIALELLFGNDSEPIVSYSPQRRGVPPSVAETFLMSPHAAPLAGAAPILKGSRVNRRHRFWRTWWDAYGAQLHGAVRRQVTGRSGVSAETLKQYERQASDSHYPRDPVLEAFVLGMRDSFRRIGLLRRHFQDQGSYSFERALADIERDHQDAYAICRGFIPVECTSVSSDANLLPIVRDHFEKQGINIPVPDLTPLLVYACLLLRQGLEGMAYVGPLRESPERHYIFRGNVTEHVGKTGKTVPDVLFKRPALITTVNRWLETLELNYQLSLSQLTGADQGGSDVFSVRLVDSHTNISASVLDVGFGISQLLPIVVQSLLSRNRLICIEQPEIHLHPRLQATLGSLFYEASKDPYNNRFLIETHSEHIMLRLQGLIRNGRLPSSNVSVLYVDRGPGGSSCIELRLNDRGDFVDRWPGGFLEESYREMFDFAVTEDV